MRTIGPVHCKLGGGGGYHKNTLLFRCTRAQGLREKRDGWGTSLSHGSIEMGG